MKLIPSRGLVGMANSGKRNTNTSQFFFTLDKADELTNKHTMFGKVVGNTIYSESSCVSYLLPEVPSGNRADRGDKRETSDKELRQEEEKLLMIRSNGLDAIGCRRE